MTAPTLDAAALLEQGVALLEAEHGRSAQRAVGGSEIGDCARLIRWTQDGRPFTDPDTPSMVATIGTAAHAYLLPAMARASGDPFARVEVPVVARIGGLDIPGSVDLFAHRRAVDLKTRSSLDGVRKYGPKVEEIAQVATYVEGLRQAGEQVDGATLLYLDRAYGDTLEVNLDESELEDVLAVLEAFVAQALADEAAPRVDVTGRDRRSTDTVCTYCRFRSGCWGDPPRPAVLVHEGRVDVLDALEQYADAAERRKVAEADRTWWSMVLEDVEAGVYGGWRLKRKRGSAPGVTLDGDRAREALEAAGLEVPLKATSGRRGSIEVVPAPVQD